MFYPSLLHDFLRESARRLPDKPFIVADGRSWTFAEIDGASSRLAALLLKSGLAPGDRAAVLLDNCAEAVIAVYGISKAAATFTLLSSTMKANKLAYVLRNCQARVLITDASRVRIVKAACEELAEAPVVVLIAPPALAHAAGMLEKCVRWEALNDLPAPAPDALPRAIDQDLAALIYTSGSTGEPKGVMQPHFRVVAVAKSIVEYLGNDEHDVILNVLSLSFGYGLYQVLMAAMFGGTVVLEKSFVYLHDVLNKIAAHRVTGFPFVPPVLAMMLKMREVQSYDFSSLRYVTNAGAALPVPYARKLRELMPHVRVYPMYGLTECVRVCYLAPEEVDRRPDSVGFEIPNCRVFVVDAEGRPVGPNEVGELVVTGVNVMNGYFGDPALTARVFRPGPSQGETWLYTGDLFRRDADGFLYFVARKDDMIKTRGERVSPAEVENRLLEMPGVAECAVIGVPDDIFGHVIRAFVVPGDGQALSEQQVLRYAAATMESFMVPKDAVVLAALPRTPNGKIDKKQLDARPAG
jgi:long-chain acyl-CoA synthetase